MGKVNLVSAGTGNLEALLEFPPLFQRAQKKELVMERKMLRIASVVFVASVLIGVVGCAKPKVQVQVS